ncbi:MAG TPA: citrate synthase [Thermoanaerobaculia bacterium]|nr:citrate synthase [Thermoanaerobaculia bacterium]
MKTAENEARAFREGLEDIVAAESSICYIDGVRGVLSYRGYDIHDLAEHASFEEVCFLLWEGRLPAAPELAETRASLGAERAVPEEILSLVRGFLVRRMVPMDVLRTAVSALSETDPDVASNEPDANRRKAVRLTARMATIVAAIRRFRDGKDPVEPDPARGHAEDFLWMLNGAPPSTGMVRAFDTALVLHADHELNASTFAARVTAATLSDMHSAIVSAIGTLKGPLHGGANEAVIRMLIEIGDPSRVDEAIRARLAAKKKIMGFGHRVYTTEDPRATHLRGMSRDLAQSTGDDRWYAMSRRIEELVREEKGLNCNVDFYSASTYYMLGIPPDLYTPIFALSRCAGWTAHVMEQHRNNRLIRPRAEYLGPAYRQPWLPLDQR